MASCFHQKFSVILPLHGSDVTGSLSASSPAPTEAVGGCDRSHRHASRRVKLIYTFPPPHDMYKISVLGRGPCPGLATDVH